MGVEVGGGRRISQLNWSTKYRAPKSHKEAKPSMNRQDKGRKGGRARANGLRHVRSAVLTAQDVSENPFNPLFPQDHFSICFVTQNMAHPHIDTYRHRSNTIHTLYILISYPYLKNARYLEKYSVPPQICARQFRQLFYILFIIIFSKNLRGSTGWWYCCMFPNSHLASNKF